jgi:hypothetical protein
MALCLVNWALCHEDIGEWRYSFSLLYLVTRWRCTVSFTPLPLYPRGKSLQYAFDKRLGGPQIRFGQRGDKNLSLPGMDPGSSSPSLYRLRYLDSIQNNRACLYLFTYCSVEKSAGSIIIYYNRNCSRNVIPGSVSLFHLRCSHKKYLTRYCDVRMFLLRLRLSATKPTAGSVSLIFPTAEWHCSCISRVDLPHVVLF